MDIIIDTKSCHYRTTWEMFIKHNEWDENALASNVVLIDCDGASDADIKERVRSYKGKTVFLVNTSPKQAAIAVGIFYSDTPVSSVLESIRSYLKPTRPISVGYPFGLTDKEVSIVRMLLQGMSNKEISKVFDFSVSTTKYHLQKIYKKMNVSNRTEAALAGVKINL